MINKIKRRKKINVSCTKQIEDLINYLNVFSAVLKNKKKVYSQYVELLESVNKSDAVWHILKKNENILTEIIEKYRPKPKVIRYVDFNQGIDARLINNENCTLLAKLPIRPFRLAYDNLKETKNFLCATKLAIKHGISDFSNYMLYNFEDRPTELWSRLFNAITLYNNSKRKISAFSFPMKYAPIDEKDRNYIGKYWNKKYLSAVGIILNVTKGVVVKEFDFFYEAYGETKEEYIKILTMPDEFIRFRHFFRDNGLLFLWQDLYDDLTNTEKKRLLKILCDIKSDRKLLSEQYTKNIDKILQLYAINKSQFDRGEIKADTLIKRIIKSEKIYQKFQGKEISSNFPVRYSASSNGM